MVTISKHIFETKGGLDVFFQLSPHDQESVIRQVIRRSQSQSSFGSDGGDVTEVLCELTVSKLFRVLDDKIHLGEIDEDENVKKSLKDFDIVVLDTSHWFLNNLLFRGIRILFGKIFFPHTRYVTVDEEKCGCTFRERVALHDKRTAEYLRDYPKFKFQYYEKFGTLTVLPKLETLLTIQKLLPSPHKELLDKVLNSV
jgi:hypothetical protein